MRRVSEPQGLAALVGLSKFAGERFDLVQAGGGNASVKLSSGSMLIKASGFLLSEVEPDRGYARVDLRTLTAAEGPRPSMETSLHALLARYTLHTHPLVVTALASRKKWRTELSLLFPDAALVAYRTPGAELAAQLGRVLREHRARHRKAPEVIFLQNHGLIVSSDRPDAVRRLTESVILRIERRLKIDMGRYKMTTRVSALLGRSAGGRPVAYLSEDAALASFRRARKDLFSRPPFFPDGLVYCGMRPVQLRSLDDRRAVAAYRARYREEPRVVLHRDRIFFIAQNTRKAKEAEEVYKAHILTLRLAGTAAAFLPRKELLHLGRLSAEKFRRRL